MSQLTKAIRKLSDLFSRKDRQQQSQGIETSETGGSSGYGLTYFLHIPKTSGTSLYHFIIEIVGKEHALPPMPWDPLIMREHEITEQTTLVSGHMNGLLPLWLGRWPRTITMLRDPIARALSNINHVQRETTHPLHSLAQSLSIEEYCAHPKLRLSVDNLQSRYLASLSISAALLPKKNRALGESSWLIEHALYGLDSAFGLKEEAIRAFDCLDVLGICEAQEASLQLVAREFGWEHKPEERKLNAARTGQKSTANLNDSETQALAAVNQIDMQVYEEACRRFTETCNRFGISWEMAQRPTFKAA